MKIAYWINGDDVIAKGLPQIAGKSSRNSVSLLGFAAKLAAYLNIRKEKKRKKEKGKKS